MKQPDPEILLQGMNLMADRRGSDEQLLGGFAEAPVARRRLERAQRPERRQMVVRTDEQI